VKTVLTALVFTLLSSVSFAQPAPDTQPVTAAKPEPAPTPVPSPKPLTHESEVGIASASGNSDSNTYNVKQQTSYAYDRDKWTFTARYLNTNSNGADTAKNWDGALRFDRTLTGWWTLFASFGLEADRFAGFTQRNNHDIGTRYDLVKSNETNLFTEVGYRYTYTMYTTAPAGVDAAANIIRVYLEGTQKVLDRTSARVWVEYLPSFNAPEDYRINFEPSFVSQLNGFLSLKIGYLVKYHNVVVAPATTYSDRLFTTALVAKF
jgi:putative salt-induced outer membrane protein